MSKKIIKQIKCNECNTILDFEVYESVNVTLQPTLKEKVLNDSIYLLECSECGKKFYLSYPFLYNDMDSGYMINLNNSNNKEEEIQTFRDLVANINKEMKDTFGDISYKYRSVDDIEILREKIRIFDRNLDDRIIELYKYEFIVNGYDKELDMLDDILFVNTDGSMECLFVLFEKDVVDNVRMIAFDEMEYMRLEKEFEYEIEKYNDVVIDLVWAQKVYNNVMVNS